MSPADRNKATMSPLDRLTEDVKNRKDDKATKLTPVGMERATANRIPDVPEVFLTQEAVLDIAKDLRVQAATLIAVADGLDAHAGREPALVGNQPSPLELQQAIEKAADEAHDDRVWAEAAKAVVVQGEEGLPERMARLAREAQAHVYGDVMPEVAVTNVDGWMCPVHGDAAIINKISRKQRKFRACAECDEFEK